MTQTESSTIKELLLKEFLPGDVCPLGAQLFLDTPQPMYQLDPKENKPVEEVLYLVIPLCLAFKAHKWFFFLVRLLVTL